MPAEEAIQKGQSILERMEEIGIVSSRCSVLLDVALLESMSGRFDDARRLMSQSLAVGADMGERDFALAIWGDGKIEALAGDEVLAESEMRRAFEMCERSENKGLISSLAAELGRLLCGQNRAEEARSWIELSAAATSADDIHPQVVCRSVRGRILAFEGLFPEAEPLAREAVERARETDWLELQADALSDLAEVLLLADQRDGAIEQATEALLLYEQKGHVVGARRTRSLLEEIGSSNDLG